MCWKVIMYLLFCSHMLSAQRKISGIISDEVSQKPLTAFITMKNRNGKVTNFTSSNDGRYLFAVPAGTDTIFYKKSGYRPSWIVMGAQDPDQETLSVDIKLLPTDKQALNTIYQQSEQTHTVIEKSTGKTAGQIFVISAVDAVSGENVPADFALFATSSKGKMQYVTTMEKKSFEVVFTEKDIIALEVYSNGYEAYKGNLVIKSFGPKKANIIRLTRGESVLNLKITGLDAAAGADIRCELLGASGTKYPLRATASRLTFNGSIRQTGPATIQVYRSNSLIYSEKMDLKRGINEKKLFINGDGTINSAIDASVPPSDTVIYFNQSSPELRADAKKVLMLVAAQLNMHEKLRLRLIGHTDNVGAKNRNLILSEYRVKATRQYLTQLGISDQRITAGWKGGEMPAQPNDEEQHKQLNRRVELFFEKGN